MGARATTDTEEEANKGHTMSREKITHAEFLERLEKQGVESKHYAFVCPICKTVQSPAVFDRIGVARDTIYKYVGFSCIGRFTKAGPAFMQDPAKQVGCDWTLGGLLQLHELEVETENGELHMHFQPATPDQAQALKAKVEAMTP